ncbi:MAG: cytochrome b/b6 domain-containing protein, partial [Casimicrobium sp.]
VWHMRSGYAILALVLFRLIWGFVGGEYARFTSFLTGPMRSLNFAKGLLGKGHQPVIGHNPVGGWMVVVLLVLLATQAVLGLFSNDEIATTGPLARYVSDETSITLMSRHRNIGDLLLILVGVHIAAVLFHVFVKKEGIVRAMFTGRKDLPSALASEARAARKASYPLGFIVLSIAIAAVVVAVNWPTLFKS